MHITKDYGDYMAQYVSLNINIADSRAIEDATAKQIRNKADIDFIALMTDIELETETDEFNRMTVSGVDGEEA